MIKFILNNNLIQTNVKTGMTLLNFIREEQRLKGTKSGCKEGDCGACTVLEGTLLDDGTIKYKSITSCLSPIANVQGKHIVTVEGINLDKELNISQLAIKDNYATQCGFCTPGFVISLTGSALKKEHLSYSNIINDLSGNICRCTGYKSIEKAAYDVGKSLNNKDLNNNLQWLIDNKFIPDYFIDIPKRLKDLSYLDIEKEGILVAGGTDIYVRHADDLAEVNIKQVKFIVPDKITFSDKKCTLGMGVSITDLMGDMKLKEYFPNLKKHLRLISSEQIRNMGTIGGNIVNASPIADMSIFFLALNSTLVIKNYVGEERTVLFKDFFKDYKLFDLSKNEFIQSLIFEFPDKNTRFNFEKVSKRAYLDIASVNSALSIKIIDNIIKDIHISIGGVAAIPKYLNKTVDFLLNKSLTKALIFDANEILQEEISPISDIRGSIEYKRLLARQLFYVHFMELFPDVFK